MSAIHLVRSLAKQQGARGWADSECPLLTAILAALPAQLALLDAEGIVCWTNANWSQAPLGANYLLACDRGMAEGIRGVLSGGQTSFAWGARASVVSVLDGALVVCFDTAEEAQKLEAVGRLAGGVVHDFNNLLTLISGYSDILLARMSAADPLRPEMEEIRAAANRGTSLTMQLLAFSRRQAVQRRSVDLNGLIGEMEKMLRRMIGEDVELVTVLNPGLCPVSADAGQVEQVIMNLALNARDAMPKGGEIIIRTENVTLDAVESARLNLAAGEYAMMAFSDTGDGMTPETLKHAFEPFYTTKAIGKGTGLGLSTVHSIVRQSGGDISVRTETGRGTSFIIYLPASHEENDTLPDKPQAASAAASNETAVPCETILLAEDESGVRKLIKYILSRQGYKVLEACDGQEAIELYESYPGPIHMLLTDMVMPRVNGHELVEALLQRQPDLRVLCMSGYTDEVLGRGGATHKGLAFLNKPIKPALLADKIREVLSTPVPTLNAAI